MERMPKRWWLWLLLALVLVQIGRGFHDYMHEREISRQAEDWLDHARFVATEAPGPTLQKAAQWLRRSGFSRVVFARTHGTEESIGKPTVEEDYAEVIGTRQLSAGGLLTRPAWIELHFRFTPDEKEFLRADYEIKR